MQHFDDLLSDPDFPRVGTLGTELTADHIRNLMKHLEEQSALPPPPPFCWLCNQPCTEGLTKHFYDKHPEWLEGGDP